MLKCINATFDCPYQSTMKITEYKDSYKDRCIEIFESNLPGFFADDEKRLFIDYLDKFGSENYYVVKKDSNIVACGGIYFDEKTNTAGLAWGMVHADFQSRGIGKEFTTYRIDLLKATFPGSKYEIETSQHTAAFYRKLGFVTDEVIIDGFGKGFDKYNMSMG
jgi:GNAT superfamily N-acetyltransferase